MRAVMILALAALPAVCVGGSLDTLLDEFKEYSGASLVFRRTDLPPGTYHDAMPELPAARQVKAAKLLLDEVKKYPPRFLGNINLKAIGIFRACVSTTGDGFRPFSPQLKGYQYFGIWNGRDGIAGAYYTDEQLPLTFHHEIFHHIDATYLGKTSYAAHFKSDDTRFHAAISGDQVYRSPYISDADIQALKAKRRGYLLRKTVSNYSAKHAGEDQAETARHFMTSLADSLFQAVRNPHLEGSQRIMHVMREMERAIPAGPGPAWFVNVALGRPQPSTPGALVDRLALLKEQDEVAPAEIRGILRAVERQLDELKKSDDDEKVAGVTANLTHEIIRQRIRPDRNDEQFVVWGKEDSRGVNWTLRSDLLSFAEDAMRLKRIASIDPELLARTQLKNLRLLARYYVYIDSNWTITPGTQEVFEAARDSMAMGLPVQQAALKETIKSTQLKELAVLIEASGDPKAFGTRTAYKRKVLRSLKNPYLQNVDKEIKDGEKRVFIKKVQPACVSFGNASGVNLHPEGWILTAAHVVDKKGARRHVTFPDGRMHSGICTAIDPKLDLAILKLFNASPVPYAPVATVSPRNGSWITCIGQPGTRTPKGQPTGYQPFHVSTGSIRGFLGNPLGSQRLGRTKHDAWTYWGHSGGPLFNQHGQIVGLHNSWDPSTAMRHAVSHEAIVHFLKKARVRYFTKVE